MTLIHFAVAALLVVPLEAADAPPALASAGAAPARRPTLIPVAMPDGGAGIGFDDLGWAAGLEKVLVPGGRTGKLFLLDPATHEISSLGGFSADKAYKGGHGEGVTSADEGGGLLFATDRDAVTVNAIDPKSGKIVATAKLGGPPDYVRHVAATNEVWVSEPNAERIEIFSLPALTFAAAIAVPGGPEFLLIDGARGRAYANTWKAESLAISLKERKIVARWNNGCEGSRGQALDAKRGFLFIGCDEGKAVVLDAGKNGAVLSTLSSGKGVDVIAYNPKLRHLYLPGAASATVAVMSVSEAGKLRLVKTVPTAKGAHCATADERGGAWVCDPDHGRMLFLRDSGDASR